MATAAPTSLNPDEQVKNVLTYDDTLPAGSGLEVTGSAIEDNIHAILSQLNRIINSTTAGNDWFQGLVAPSALDPGTVRGVNDINDDLHSIERKRILKRLVMVGVDVTIAAAGNQFVILDAADIPSTTTAAVGAVTTTGTVVADASGSFGTAQLTEVAGANDLQPKNLCVLTDNSTGDVVTRSSDGRQIYGLLQSENATDGFTISGTTPNRVQISFVVHNSTNDDLELVAAGDMDGITFDYAYVRRDAFADCPEEAWLGDGFADTGVTAATRQAGYDNQGTGAVLTTSNATLDVGAGFSWELGDAASAALFTITEDSGGGATDLAIGADVDTYNNNAIDVNFDNGLTADNGSNAINIGVTADQIDFTGNGTLTASSASTVTVTADSASVSMTTTTSGNVVINSAGSVSSTAVGATDIDGAGAVSINSTGGAINIGNDADAQAINVGTGAAARTITVGNATGATAVNMDAGTGAFSLDSTVGGSAALMTLTTTGADGDSVEVFVSDLDPSAGAGIPAPVGSTLHRDSGGTGTTGEMWLKTGAADTAWEIIIVGTAGQETLQEAYEFGNTITTSAPEGPFDVSGTEAISLDAQTASNFTVDGANLLLSTTTSGALQLSSDANIVQSASTSWAASTVTGAATITSGLTATVQSTGDATFRSTGQGGNVVVTTANTGAGAVGDISLTGGDYTGVGSETGGGISLTGGSATSGTGSDGGELTFTAGDGFGAFSGGAVTTTAGAGGATGDGGAILITSGAGGITSGASGNVTISSGDVPVGNSDASGNISVGSATPTGTGNSGDVDITTGDSDSAAGALSITTGLGDTAGNSGDITVQAGNNVNAAGVAGGIEILAGIATTAGGAGGGLTLRGGGNVSAGGVGVTRLIGSVGLSPGADSGTVYIIGSNASAAGGDVTITSGAGATATDTGVVTIGCGGSNANIPFDSSSLVTTEAQPVVNFANNGTGAGLGAGGFINLFVSDPDDGGSASPNTVVTGRSGSLFFKNASGAGSGELWLNTSTGASGTAWEQVVTGTSPVTLEEAIENTGTSPAVLGGVSGSTSFEVEIQDGSNWIFSESVGGLNLLTVEANSATNASTVAAIADSITLTGQTNTGAAGGTVTVSGGGSDTAPGAVTVSAGDHTGTGAGADLTLNAGDGGTTSGAGGNVVVNAGTPTDGDGGTVTLTGSAGVGTNRDGGNITLVPGANTGTGVAGVVGVDSALGINEPVFRLDRADGTSGVTIDMFNGSVDPENNVTGDEGDVYFRDGAENAIYIKETGDANNTGWERVTTASSAVTRQFYQTTMASTVTGPGAIQNADLNGGLPTKPTSNFNFDTDAEIYLNGILLWNGSSGEVEDGTGDEINLVGSAPTFTANDVVTIIYYTNSN